MDVTLIAAVSEEGVIGRAGGLPWRLADDMSRFRSVTLGKPIIMGRKTWDSLPRKPLQGRLNIVVTRQAAPIGGAVSVPSIVDALAEGRQSGAKEAMVIGGGEIYALAMPFADRLMLTRVSVRVPDGDTFFPAYNHVVWTLVSDVPSPDEAVRYQTFETISKN
jgi:dihydrofolate reductase